MIIPRTVKIGANIHKVVWRDGIKNSDGISDNLGKAFPYLLRIELVSVVDGEDIPEGSIADTFLHEVLHTCSNTYGLDLSEDQVAGLAGGLLQVIRDNDLDFRRPDMACKGKGGKKKGKGK